MKSIYLEKEPYNEDVVRNALSRERRPDLEIGHDMRYGIRTENERIREQLIYLRPLDYAPREMKWYHWPKWKLDQKNKWKTSYGFKHRNGRCKMRQQCDLVKG